MHTLEQTNWFAMTIMMYENLGLWCICIMRYCN